MGSPPQQRKQRLAHLARALRATPPGAVVALCGTGAEEPDEAPLSVEFHDVAAASFRLRGGVRRTPCVHSLRCSQMCGVDVHFKEDLKQLTGSFKERGARNALLLLEPGQRSAGVITASAGNHALALSHHAAILGIPATCVMPTTAPLTKVSRCREVGATVVLHGAHIGEAREKAMIIAAEEGRQYINGYDDPAIIAGAGTLAIEMLDDLGDAACDAVLIPVGGGGLIAGMATVLKALRPEIEVIGVEPAECASLTAALAAGKPMEVPFTGTLADGLAVPIMGSNAYEICTASHTSS